MVADKSLSGEGQPADKGGKKPSTTRSVTSAQWLAVLAIWALAAYGALAPRETQAGQDRVHLIACR
jgi:hypothetical protein